MKDLIDILPAIILYMSSGFVFLRVFNFVSVVRPAGDFEHVFVKSLIAGFILCTIADLFPWQFKSQYANIAILLAVCGVSGLAFGRLYVSAFWEKALEKLGIRRTVNPYIWKDIVDIEKGVWVYLEFRDLDRAYLGALSAYEEFEKYPRVLLERYDERTLSSGKKSEAAVDDPTRRILLDTAHADIIEIFYTDDSPKIDGTKQAISKSKQIGPSNGGAQH